MGKKLSYTPESVERALELHKASGLIREWGRNGDKRYFAVSARADRIELRSLREAYVYVNGLGHAANSGKVT